MKYYLDFSKDFQKSMRKIAKKNKVLFIQINKKLDEIIDNPEHYKPLKNELFGFRRVHFGSFVLVFKIDQNIIEIISIDHHGKAYS